MDLPPDNVLTEMADAMLDPALRAEPFNKITSTPGNVVRKEVIKRALRAAEQMGWALVKLPDKTP